MRLPQDISSGISHQSFHGNDFDLLKRIVAATMLSQTRIEHPKMSYYPLRLSEDVSINERSQRNYCYLVSIASTPLARCLSLLKYSVSNSLLNIYRIQSTSTHTYCLFPTMLKNDFGANFSTALSTWRQNFLRKRHRIEVYFNV